MQILINDWTAYFRLKTVRPEEIPISTISDVECGLLYDADENLIGLRVYKKEFNSAYRIELPRLGEQEEKVTGLEFIETTDDITLMFDSKGIVKIEEIQDCLIDYCDRGILGIELLKVAPMDGMEVIKPFLIT